MLRRLLIPLCLFVLTLTATGAQAAASWSGTVIGFGGMAVAGGDNRFLATAVSASGQLTTLSLASEPRIGERLQISGGQLRGLQLIADDRVKSVGVKDLGNASIVLIRHAQINVLRSDVYQFVSHGGSTPDFWPPEVSFSPEQASWVLNASDQHIVSTVVIEIRNGLLYHLSPRPTALRGSESLQLQGKVARDVSGYLAALMAGNYRFACQRTTTVGLAQMGGYGNCLKLFASFGQLYRSSTLTVKSVTLSGVSDQVALVTVVRSDRRKRGSSTTTTAMFVLERGYYRFQREFS